jgi:hemerythrin-like domain-containing protein
MTIDDPIGVLMNEHQIILRVLDALETRIARIRTGSFDPEFFESALDFFRNFADGCHHFKEEDTLFPEMIAAGIPSEGGPIGCMLHEHGFGRSCLKAVRENLEPAAGGSAEARATVASQSRAYLDMLRQHINKEDQILYQMAYRALTPEAMDRLRQVFGDESNPKINAPVREKYLSLAERLTGGAAASA